MDEAIEVILNSIIKKAGGFPIMSSLLSLAN